MCAQSCLTLSDPMDYNPPGSSVHGIFQERIMEWIADSYFRGPGNQVIINTFPACLFGPGVSKVIWPRPSLIPPSEKFFAIHQGLLWLLKGISCGITPISVVFGHCPKWRSRGLASQSSCPHVSHACSQPLTIPFPPTPFSENFPR